MSGSRGRQPRSHHSAARGRDSTGSRRHDSARGGGDSTGGRIHDSAHGHDSTGSRPQDSSPNDRQRQGCTRFTPLSAHDAENLGRGYAGSTSDVGISDQMDDTQRIIKRRRVHEAHNSGIDPDNDSEEDDDDTQRDSNVADTPHRYGDTRPYLEKFGKKFASYQVHHHIRLIFDQFLDGAWPTFTKLPPTVFQQMFRAFGKYYRWDSVNDGMIESGFRSVVQDRYSDIMSEYRHESANRARAAGHNIPNTNNDFAIMRDFEPISFNEDVWKDLCKYWDTDAWRKKSVAGRANRMSGDDTGTVSRHTGGSRGYDQYRLELQKELKRIPTFLELFLITHLTAEAKKKFKAKDYDTIQELEFCTPTARAICERYTSAMVEKYGEDLTQHPEGDVDLWVQAQEGRGKCRRIYGVGSSDLHFVVTGTSSNGNKPTSSEYQQSQQRVQELEEAHAELARQNGEMAKRQAQMEKQMAEMVEFMRRYDTNNCPNNPSNPSNAP
ncbi:uncharacterized protein LOC111897093 [Lactuca sativa]|uniref:uncharacterized protein LOC111897093 n=2 Tax=Lactuca sativa TaxID=4236 RepID=UPI000CD9BAC6|nr:uncharacterized protein LOC111897093 [Lactuca sativa]